MTAESAVEISSVIRLRWVWLELGFGIGIALVVVGFFYCLGFGLGVRVSVRVRVRVIRLWWACERLSRQQPSLPVAIESSSRLKCLRRLRHSSRTASYDAGVRKLVL